MREKKLSSIMTLVGTKVKVLNLGYVELTNYMGDDATVVECARQSYGKNEDSLTIETIDRQIKEMLKNGHSSPFEQVVFQFHLKMPIFVQRQFVRHRTARMNEISGRYTKFDENNFFIPDDNCLTKRKSYSDDNPDDKTISIEKLRRVTKKNIHSSYDIYNELVEDKDIPYELARINLPLSLYTEFYWQMDLHNLLHFLKLRLDEHAQKEIREYASIIYKIVEKICPITIKYFTEYELNSTTLGQSDINTINKLINNLSKLADGYEMSPEEQRIVNNLNSIVKRNREREMCNLSIT
jgi:thymidylate synthase (FAD)